MAHDILFGTLSRDWARGSQPSAKVVGSPAIDKIASIEYEIKDLESNIGKGGGESAQKVAAGTGRVISSFAKTVGKGLGSLASAVTSKKSSGSPRASSRPSGTPFTHKLSNALIRHTHRSELKRYSKIEKKSAQGSPAHQKYVARQVSLANQGDKKALASVQAMKLTRMVRLASKTPADRKYLSAGNKLAKGVLKKKPRAIQQYKQIQAAAGRGNPHAKKILAGAGISSAVIATVATGRVVLPKSSASKQKTILTKQANEARHRALTGKITKEEAETGAKAAKQLGDTRTETYLSQIAKKAPPSKPTTTPATKPPIQQEQAQAEETSPEGSSSPGTRESTPDEGPAASPKEIQTLYTKLWTEHARQLAQHDQENHLPPKSLENYQTLSKLWAKEELAKQGIPTDSLAGKTQDLLGFLLDTPSDLW